MVFHPVLFRLACICIALYFVILAAERIQSLVRAGKHKVLCKDGLHQYMSVLCCISFAGTILLFVVFAVALLTGNTQNAVGMTNLQLLILCSAVGTFLLSGMVHTEYTIPGIQFGAYGVLIVGMLLWMLMQKDILDLGRRILTLCYIVAFSMAIPVVYPSNIEKKKVFHITESVVSAVLVILFTVLLYGFFAGHYEWLFHPAFLLIAVAGDVPVILLRRKEEVNWFVLVSLAIAVVLWIVGLFLHMV